MLHVTLLSGEDLAAFPFSELSDVKALKQRLHEQHGLPPRFRQRLFHEENALDDAVTLASVMESQAIHEDTTLSDAVKPDAVMHLQALVLEFSDASHAQRIELDDAARCGLLHEVEALLQLPMDPDVVLNEYGHTPLMQASGNGHVEIVRLLLEAGAQKDALDCDGTTALIWAAHDGRDSVVEVLLEAGVQKDIRENIGWTALMCYLEILSRTFSGKTALMLAADENADAEVVRLLQPVAETP
ncbi:Kinase D-interacting substrate of 220 kDa [Symbiodinium microadriaticum]|uniref:Kinase D-interacting substrate of 220 kDa n=1 Tax=Symbiodinium microadriaticum TaxID=2951 RepID=A0A1Q9EUN8_SYMMI|nr:Kinase D-interacting substrate of 220 kDa [Symbiodinium microadriaticum]